MDRHQAVESPPLLLTATQAAHICNSSERTWRTWDAMGNVPRAVVIGRSKFWRPAEICDWVGHGCPNRRTWDAMIDGKTF